MTLHHTFGGSGPPLVLIHGIGSAGYLEWRANLQPFARSHTVYAPDLPGYGRSDKPPGERYSIPFFADTISRYLDEVGLSSTSLAGTSLGGGIALQLALTEPARLERLVLVCALGLGRPRINPLYPLMALPGVGELGMRAAAHGLRVAPRDLVRRVAARLTGTTDDPDRLMTDRYLNDLRELHHSDGYAAAYLATVRSLFAGRFDVSSRLGEIDQPVLLIWGTRDPLFPVEHATRAHRLLPSSQLLILEGAGHTPQAERPQDFNRAVLDFLGT
ncbi:MAG TPA: alpha/beta fold hydrolase [Candidatus Dormibacteraeota bacterium]